MKILIAASKGFIGSYIVEIFPGQAEVWVLDNFDLSFQRHSNGSRGQFIKACRLDSDHVQTVIRRVYFFILNHVFQHTNLNNKPPRP